MYSHEAGSHTLRDSVMLFHCLRQLLRLSDAVSQFAAVTATQWCCFTVCGSNCDSVMLFHCLRRPLRLSDAVSLFAAVTAANSETTSLSRVKYCKVRFFWYHAHSKVRLWNIKFGMVFFHDLIAFTSTQLKSNINIMLQVWFSTYHFVYIYFKSQFTNIAYLPFLYAFLVYTLLPWKQNKLVGVQQTLQNACTVRAFIGRCQYSVKFK